MERVVVTGLGAVSCAGNDVQAFWDSLTNGRSGIARIASFDPDRLASQIAGEVKGFEFDARLGKRMARFAQLAFAAASEALGQSGLLESTVEEAALARIGVCIGSGIGGEPFLEQQHAKYLERGPGRFHPLTVPIVISNMASANVAMHYELQGPNLCVSTACATGNHAVGTALDMIRLGRADAMIAGGCESTISEFAIDGYIQLKALSARNDDPQSASRPFSRERDGFVLAEGAGVLVLESLSHAQGRGAEILGEVAGYGASADATHLTAPHPESRGAVQAIRMALVDAALNPEDVDYINAHGTSTPLNDALETQAVKAVFGEAAARIPVSSIKSMIGHGLGAAAGLEAVATVLMLHHGVIAPTINLHDPDPALDLDYVPNTARDVSLSTALSNSFAFGGHNAVIAFRRFE